MVYPLRKYDHFIGNKPGLHNVDQYLVKDNKPGQS